MRKNFFLFSLMLALLLTFSLTTSNQTYAYKIDQNHNVYGWIVGGFKATMESERGNVWNNNGKIGFEVAGLRLGVNGYAFDKVFYDVQLKGEQMAIGTLSNGMIENAFIRFEQFAPYLSITFGGLPLNSFNRGYNATSGFKQALVNRAPADTFFSHYDDLGLLLQSAILDKKLNISVGFWNGGGGPAGNYKALLADNDFTITARIQFDFFKPWKNGEEYFEKGMNATVGIGILYAGATNGGNSAPDPFSKVAGNYGAKSVFGFTADLGFHYDTFLYLEGSLTMFSGKNKALGTSYHSITAFQVTLGSVILDNALGIFARLSNVSGAQMTTDTTTNSSATSASAVSESSSSPKKYEIRLCS